MVKSQMQKDIQEAKKQIADVVKHIPSLKLREATYNIAVKAYMKGYHNALKNTETALEAVANQE